MDYTFTPYVGIGPVRFGMSRSAIEAALGMSPSHVQNKDKILGTTRIFFDDLGVMVDVDEMDICCSIEVPADSCLVFQGERWLPTTYGALMNRLRALGVSIHEEHDGLRCDDLGLACWAPDKFEDDANPVTAEVRSVFLYRQGYHAWIEDLLRLRGPWEPTDP